MNVVLAFVLGLVGGSFINAAVWRAHKGKNIIWARSQCIHCGHKLGFFDLIPVVSFFILGGRCRYCRKKISWQYPLVELASGLGFYFLAARFDLDLFIWLAGIFLITVFVFVYDLKYLLIPNGAIFLGLAGVALGLAYFKRLGSGHEFLTAILIFAFFFLLHHFSRGRWVGGGDAKLGFFLGLWLGWPAGLTAVILAYILGAVVGLALMATKQVTLKSKIPFGPFLVTGAWLAYLWSESILGWYGGLLLLN